jgi:hypothetical protein
MWMNMPFRCEERVLRNENRVGDLALSLLSDLLSTCTLKKCQRNRLKFSFGRDVRDKSDRELKNSFSFISTNVNDPRGTCVSSHFRALVVFCWLIQVSSSNFTENRVNRESSEQIIWHLPKLFCQTLESLTTRFSLALTIRGEIRVRREVSYSNLITLVFTVTREYPRRIPEKSWHFYMIAAVFFKAVSI